MSKGITIVVSSSGTEPVTLAEAKEQLRVDDTHSDSYITMLIVAARAAAEAHLKCNLVSHTLQTIYTGFVDVITTESRILAVTGIDYVDELGANQTIPPEDVVIENGVYGSIYPITEWPTVYEKNREVKVNYTVEPLGPISEDIKIALLLTITDLYENRSDSVRERRTASEVFLNRYRVPTL